MFISLDPAYIFVLLLSIICLRVIDLIDFTGIHFLFPIDSLYFEFLGVDLFSYASALIPSWGSQVFPQPLIPHISVSSKLFCKRFWFEHLLPSWYYLAVLKHFNIWGESDSKHSRNFDFSCLWYIALLMSVDDACPWVDSDLWQSLI